jgi:hypothetical protein
MIVGSLVLLLIAGTPPAEPSGPRAQLVISARSTRKGVELVTVLKNVGSQPLWVNSLLGVESETCRPARTSIRMTLIDARNRTLPSHCNANPVPARAEHYVVLPAGRELTASHDLWCYHFERGERIRIEAVYWDPSDAAPKPPAGAVLLSDRLDAKPFTFTAP